MFQGAVVEQYRHLCSSRGAGGHSGLHRYKVSKIKAFPVTAFIQIITGTGIRGIEELWPRRSR